MQKFPGLTISKFALCVFSVALTIQPARADEEEPSPISVLVVRGGHRYDTPEFEDMCRQLGGIQCDLVLTSHFEAMTVEEIAKKFDAILFLNQNKKYETAARHKKQYMDLAERGVGMVFLHFTLSSQPRWDEYHDLIGGKWFLKQFEPDETLHSTYFTDMTLDVKVIARDHPTTIDLDDFEMTDAFYGNIYVAPHVLSLLGTSHPGISTTIAWTHTYKNAKVVYLMPGFTKHAYENESYRRFVSNSLVYVSAQDSDPTAK